VSVAEEIRVSSRQAFVERVSGALDEVGVEYVLLHETANRPDESDSDVDLATTRDSLATLDAVVRSGAFGRLLQRFDYDIPWCRFYVVRSDEPGRRYRQLDVACDPWGIGRYGRAIAVALSESQIGSGTPRPSAAAATHYLAVKRAVKLGRAPQRLDDLRWAFDADPSSSSELLERELGNAGLALARALARGTTDLRDELNGVAREVSRQRRAARMLVRRAVFAGSRVTSRALHPTGFVACLAGPDGAGKSTLADGLETGALGAFRRTTRLHSRPGVLPPPAQLLGRQVSDGTDPHGRAPSSPIGSAARVAYLWLDYVMGWPSRVAGPRRRSSLVVLERGWLDLSVDPRRYRLAGVDRLTRSLRALLPRADLTLALDLPAERMIARKPELPLPEAEQQRRAWQSLAADPSNHIELLDASKPPAAVLDHALDAIDDRLAARHPDYAAASVALRCAGPPDHRGTPYVLARLGGRPRWLLQAHPSAGGPFRQGLYRPSHARQHVIASSLDAAHAVGCLGSSFRLDSDRGIAPVLADALDVGSLTITGALIARDGGTRTVLRLTTRGRTVAYAKVDADPGRLEHEQFVLSALARIGPRTFAVPRVLGLVEWEGLSALVLEPVALVTNGSPALGGSAVAALAELWDLRNELGPVLGSASGFGPAHGDFAPWNAGRTRTGLAAIWDWEQARTAPPLEDYFHWHTQCLVLLGTSSVAGLVNRALRPDNELRQLCSRLGLAPDDAPSLLRSYLSRSSSSTETSAAGVDARLRALALLDKSA
jgi:hypothetical protein